MSPLTPCLVCWFLMFICCSISYWQPCVNLDCTSVQMLQEQITGSKIPTSETNSYIFYKILTVNCIVPRFFHMSPTFWRVGALGPQNLKSWLEHWRLTLKAPRKTASKNVVYLCLLLNILANFSNQIRKEQSDLGPYCLQKWLLKSQADDKVDDNSCDWRFKG